MKKRAFSLLLAFTMLISTVSVYPISAASTFGEDFGMKIVGTESANFNGLDMVLYYKGSDLINVQSIMIRVDANKMHLVDSTNYADMTITSTRTKLPAKTGSGKNATDNYFAYSSSDSVYGLLENNYQVLLIQLGYDTATDMAGADYEPVTDEDGITWGKALEFSLAFTGDTTQGDLDNSSVMMNMISAQSAKNESAMVVMKSATNGDLYWAPTSTQYTENIDEPTITYPNSNVINLNGVKADATQRYVNVPVSIPSAGPAVTVQASAKGYYTSDCADGTEIESGVTYKYSVAMKDGSDLPETVSINETTGLLTIKAGAPEAVVTITAAGTYAENGSTASGTFDVSLRHGDAGEKNEADPTEPKKEEPKKADDVKPVASGVAVYEDDKQVTSSATGVTNYAKAIAVPKTDSVTVTFEGKIVDQYGDIMTDETGGNWAVTKGESDYSGTNPGFNNGVVTVATAVATADKGTYNYTFSHSTFAATVEVTVDDTAITWPTLSRNTMTYGETVSKLTINNDGSYVDSEGITHTEESLFSWDTPDATPDVATTKVVMKFDNGVEADAKTKDYAITVSKADLAIVLNSDAVIAEGDSIQLPQDNVITLADDIVLENTSVKDENGKNLVVTDIAPAYTLSDEHSLVTRDPAAGDIINTITGTKISGNNEVATLGITANGGANYNDASRTLSIKVIKPVLNASIDFDTTTPAFRQKITAIITENKDQQNSIIADAGLTYQWGEIVIENGEEKFKALETGGAGVTGNLTNITAGNYDADPAVPAKATVEYTPVVGDVGKTLALQVITPSGDTSYGWIHSVQNKMANPVARATWGTISGSVKSVTTTSVTVNGEKDAWFAIALKNNPTVTDGDEPVSDGHTWVKGYDDSGNAKDVEFTQDDAGNALTSNTEYTVFMKKEADGYETATTSFDTATAKESITPTPNPDPEKPDPIPPTITGVTVTAAIDETAGLKFGQTLTASVTVTDTVPHDPVITIDADQWEYKWYRVTPAEGENPETEEVIKTEAGVDYVGNTYTLAENDIDKVIRVKATTKDTCEYIAYANDDTSGKIAKADGPEAPTGITNSKKASNATATDGELSGVDSTMEYRLKAAEGAEEAAWTPIADGVTTITGVAGTYEIRVKATSTREAGKVAEVEIAVNGYSIIGEVTSYNAALDINYKLYKFENGAYKTEPEVEAVLVKANTADKDGSEVTAALHVHTFTIPNVENGTYRLVLSKESHCDFVVENIVVNDGDVDLTAKANITMGIGDLDHSNTVNVSDLNILLDIANYGKSSTDENDLAANTYTDLNGDTGVNVTDLNILLDATNYGSGTETHFTIVLN